MKGKRARTLAAGIVLGIFFAIALAASQGQKAEAKKEKPGPLIKKHLLDVKKENFAAPKRNIFSAGAAAFPEDRPPVLDDVVLKSAEDANSAQAVKPGEKEATPAASISLRYIGFIGSSKKAIGLVLFEGRAQALEEGDLLAAGVQVGKITQKELEILLPNGLKQKFPLEGEEE
jgi:hypothetical protein